MKQIFKKILPKGLQSKIRQAVMNKHKISCYKQEELNRLKVKTLYKDIILDRTTVYNEYKFNFNDNQQLLVSSLLKDGLFFSSLKEYYNKQEELIDYLLHLSSEVKGKAYEELENIHVPQDPEHLQYRGIHFLNLYHSKKNMNDPIKDFMTSPEIFTMAAKYLGEIPQIAMLSFLYTQENTLNERGPMLWHLDRSHDKAFRMFINPFEMTKENGATMAFPSKYTEEKYYYTYPYFNNEQAIKNGFNLDDRVHLDGPAGSFGVVDTMRNFHAGSRSKKERFLAILTYVPYVYKGDIDDKTILGDKKLFEKENEIIYDYFKNK